MKARPIEAWRSKQAREHRALSCSSGRRAGRECDDIGETLCPTSKGLFEVKIEVHEAKEAFEAGEEGAAVRLEVAKEGYQLACSLYRSATEYYLNVKP